MHFLIANDDGIAAPGLHALALEAANAGHTVTVCAPVSQQSACGHRLTLTAPMMVRPYPLPGVDAYALDGSPVDCVRIGKHIAKTPVDFCLSGINDGENIGTGLFYSGTAAAAREAAMLYIPSLAVSVQIGADEALLRFAARKAIELAQYLMRHPMPRLTFCNLNVPRLAPEDIKPVHLATIADSYYLDGYEQRINPRGVSYFWLEAKEVIEDAQPGTDVALLRQGHMTVSFVGGLMDHNDHYPTFLQD